MVKWSRVDTSAQLIASQSRLSIDPGFTFESHVVRLNIQSMLRVHVLDNLAFLPGDGT